MNTKVTYVKVREGILGNWRKLIGAFSRLESSQNLSNLVLVRGVTLGGTGKEVGDRHPKIGQGALIGAGATILGNISVGEGAMIAAGSLVLKDIPPHSMAVGNPAQIVAYLEEEDPSLTMKHGQYGFEDANTVISIGFVLLWVMFGSLFGRFSGNVKGDGRSISRLDLEFGTTGDGRNVIRPNDGEME
ncbi:hypothetical protein HPP92_022695 [Vanilla planifolia]|uniref:Serine O-acetyltransferase n=1 Tax=Vanilla planifolia TaxID=51239 RepID=A0A835UDS5_VANPL|nr:hypothetical protein HPP92_022695 [Vanilla planifolia]